MESAALRRQMSSGRLQAIAVAAVPEDAPALTIPGSAEAGGAMKSMGMQRNRQSMGGESMDSAGRAKER